LVAKADKGTVAPAASAIEIARPSVVFMLFSPRKE
jgi:hypothetical protein